MSRRRRVPRSPAPGRRERGARAATPRAPRAGTAAATATGIARPPMVGRRLQHSSAIVAAVIVAGALSATGIALLTRGGGGAPCAADAAGWNGAGGGPFGRGAAAVTVHEPRSGWRPAWAYPATASAPPVVAPPSAAFGAVYTVTADGTLVVLDAGSGRRRWSSAPRADEAGPSRVAVALDGCTAVVATAPTDTTGSSIGALRAVDLSTHQRRWGVHAADSVVAPPQLVDGVSYQGMVVAAGGGRDDVVDGYAEADGARDYHKRFNAAVLGSVASDGSHLWVGSLDQSVYDLGPAGQQLWSFTTGGVVTTAVVDGGSLLYAGSADGSVYALDPASGAQRWHVDVGSAVEVTPVLGGGILVIAGRDGGRLVAVDAATGRRRWQGPSETRVVGMVVVGDRLAVCSVDGTVRLLDLATGAERARWSGPATAVGSPAAVRGRLLVTCADGRLYALPL